MLPTAITIFCGDPSSCSHSCNTPSCHAFQNHDEFFSHPRVLTQDWSCPLKDCSSWWFRDLKAVTVPRGSDLFQKIVGLLEPEYGSEWKTGHWFKIEARSSCDYTEQVFKHEIILSFDEDWKVALSNLRAASRVEVGRQAEVKERVIGNTTTREQKNAVVKKGTSDAAAQKNGKKMKGEHDREWEMVVKEGGDEDWELI